MKAFSSCFLGLVSTILLAVGLAGIAGKLDPIMSDRTEVRPEKVATEVATFCILPDSSTRVA